MKELVEKALEVQKESFQEYLDDGYFQSIFGENKVDEAIPVISSWDFDTSDNAVFHYARISILNELLSEYNENTLEKNMCPHRWSVTFQLDCVGFGDTGEEAIEAARRYGLQDYIQSPDSFGVVKAQYANDQDTCDTCEEEE